LAVAYYACRVVASEIDSTGLYFPVLKDTVISVKHRYAGIHPRVEKDYPLVGSFEAYWQVKFCFDFVAQVMIFFVRRVFFLEPE